MKIRTTMLLSLIWGIAAAAAEENEEERDGGEIDPQEVTDAIETLIVTGTRMKLPPAQQVNNVITLTADDLEIMGVATVEEVFNRLPQNILGGTQAGGANNTTDYTGGGALGLETFNGTANVTGASTVQSARHWRTRHADPRRRETHRRIRPAGGVQRHLQHPDGDGGTRGHTARRRVGDLRSGRDRGRGEHHSAQGLQGNLRASAARRAGRSRSEPADGEHRHDLRVGPGKSDRNPELLPHGGDGSVGFEHRRGREVGRLHPVRDGQGVRLPAAPADRVVDHARSGTGRRPTR